MLLFFKITYNQKQNFEEIYRERKIEEGRHIRERIRVSSSLIKVNLDPSQFHFNSLFRFLTLITFFFSLAIYETTYS